MAVTNLKLQTELMGQSRNFTWKKKPTNVMIRKSSKIINKRSLFLKSHSNISFKKKIPSLNFPQSLVAIIALVHIAVKFLVKSWPGASHVLIQLLVQLFLAGRWAITSTTAPATSSPTTAALSSTHCLISSPEGKIRCGQLENKI